MLTEGEKKAYSTWLPMDFELYLRPRKGRRIPKAERKHLEEIEDFINNKGETK